MLHEYNFVDVQKLTSRQVALHKSTSTSEKDKEKWKECLIEDLISSEDSDEDGSFLVRPLPWRADKVTNFLCSLDKKQDKKRSRKSKIMTLERKTGLASMHAKPIAGSVPGPLHSFMNKTVVLYYTHVFSISYAILTAL